MITPAKSAIKFKGDFIFQKLANPTNKKAPPDKASDIVKIAPNSGSNRYVIPKLAYSNPNPIKVVIRELFVVEPAPFIKATAAKNSGKI